MGIYQHDLSTQEVAEVLLELIEQKGMAPPNQYASTNEFRLEWEDEDE